MRSLRFLLVAACLIVGQRANAQAVTRSDLAQAYLLIDEVASARPLPSAQRAEWNRRFDRTTLAFFGGDFSRVLRDMHALLGEMVGDSAATGPTRQVLPIRLEPGARVLVTGRDRTLEVSATVRYLVPGTTPVARTLVIRVRDAQGSVLMSGSVVVPATFGPGAAATVALDASPIINGVGRYQLEATIDGARLPATADVFVVAEPVAELRARLLRLVDALPASVDPQDRAAARARAELITERPDPNRSAEFLADPVALATAVEGEVRALAAGRKAYELRAGDYWRVFLGSTGAIPARVFAPREVALGSRVPVVVALHGAGADENMFFEGYGQGRLRALADSVGFVLVSPLTTTFAQDPAALDSTLAALERLYVIDRSRVYLIGHSMGGGVAMKIAGEQRASIRAAAVIAGVGTAPPNGTLAPTLFVAAEADLVIPEARVRAAYDQAVATGALVEFQRALGWGHTLVVGALLPDVLRWLFNR